MLQVRRHGWWLALGFAAAALCSCDGPTSDWPKSSHDLPPPDDQGTTGGNPSRPEGALDAGSAVNLDLDAGVHCSGYDESDAGVEPEDLGYPISPDAGCSPSD